jgi:hypothetical protein
MHELFFFSPGGKKRPREATKIWEKSEPCFNVAPAGTAIDLLDLLDNGSLDKKEPAVVTT